MSLVYDPKLLAELIKSATDFDRKFNKKAQANQKFATLIGKMADQLKQSYFPSDIPKITSNQSAPMNMLALNTFGNFLNYTVFYQIKVGDQRVAYSAAEADQNPDPQKWWPVSAEGTISAAAPVDLEGKRTAPKADYYVNKDLLVKYINFLLGQINNLDPNQQKLVKAMLGNIIQKINQSFDTKLTTQYQAHQTQLPDTTVVDAYVPDTLTEGDYGTNGNKKLLLSNIKSVETLRAWFRDNGISTKSTDDQSPAKWGTKDFNQCVGIRTLYLRATKMYAEQETNAEQKNTAAAYARQMQQIASEQKCDLSDIGAASQQAVVQPGDARQVSVMQLAQMLPFNSNEINIADLKMFVDMYVKLANDPKISSLAQTANQDFNNVSKYTSYPVIQMDEANTTVDGFKALVLPNQEPIQFAELLLSIINSVGSMYYQFYLSYKDHKDIKESGMAQNMEQQISAGGPQQQNKGDLLQLITDLRNAAQREYRK